MTAETLISPVDGLSLALLYIAPQEAPKGIVQIAHGMCEHKERYIPLMEFLADKGFAVVCNDQRGHGATAKSQDDLGYMGKGGWRAMVEDQKAITEWARAKWPGVPLTLFGHSMGSMIVRSYAKRYDTLIDSLIVCGCPSDNPAKAGGILLTKIIGHLRGWHYRPKIMQKMTFGAYALAFKEEHNPIAWVCSNPEILHSYREDPLCQFIFTADGFLNLLLLMKDCYTKGGQAGHPELPVHFISGEKDPCRIDDKALGKAVQLMRDQGYKEVSLKVYPGLRHEIHNETHHDEVWADILSYLAR